MASISYKEIMKQIELEAQNLCFTPVTFSEKIGINYFTLKRLLNAEQGNLKTALKLCNHVGLRLRCGGESTLEGIRAMLKEESRYQKIPRMKLAELVGVDYTTIARVLDTDNGNYSTFVAIADLLELDFVLEKVRGRIR